VKAQFENKPQYGMSHRPSWEGMPPASNLLEGETLPRDVYTHPDFSIASGAIRRGEKAANESWVALQKIRNNPDAEITVYRAGVKNELNTGDWITFSKEYARQSVEGTEKVHSFKIKAKDALFAGDDINEFGYYPKSQLINFYNQAMKGVKEVSPLITKKSSSIFKGLKNLSTKLLEKFRGMPEEITEQQYRTIVNQAIKEGVKKADLNLVENAARGQIETTGKVNLNNMATDIQAQLVPLKATPVKSPRWSNIGEDFIGDGKYGEVVYESPIKTSAGDVHFQSRRYDFAGYRGTKAESQDFPNYFSHVRYEDMKPSIPLKAKWTYRKSGNIYEVLDESGNVIKTSPTKGGAEYLVRNAYTQEHTRKILETQSDLFQKENFERELKGGWVNTKTGESLSNKKKMESLQSYNSNDPLAHLRTFREEVKRAAKDGKDTLLIPSGETAMKIEGLEETNEWYLDRGLSGVDVGRGYGGNPKLNISDLKVGENIIEGRDYLGGTPKDQATWIITNILGGGKFKAVPKNYVNLIEQKFNKPLAEIFKDKQKVQEELSGFIETFDISGKTDTKHFVYKLNEEVIPREARRMGLEVEGKVKKDNGEWWKIKIPKERAKMPVEAFGLGAFGLGLNKIKKGLENINFVRGRMEKINEGQNFDVVVDYAHTPDSLRAVYETYAPRLTQTTPRENASSQKENKYKLICVLGNTGGGRDTWKRPEMGKIADEYCDQIILTNEDPYDEDPVKIIEEVKAGIKNKLPEIIMDRRAAINKAIRKAHTLRLASLAQGTGNKSAIAVLITGKGTDPYIMEANSKKTPWDDATVAREELKKYA